MRNLTNIITSLRWDYMRLSGKILRERLLNQPVLRLGGLGAGRDAMRKVLELAD
jgi:hypothetical protein